MAFGNSTFSDIGGAVSDLFAADAYRTKARGSRMQADAYDTSAIFADWNAKLTALSTGIKETQIDRANYLGLGREEAQIGGAGFAMSGSALDLMRSSAEQGALTHAIAVQQGFVTEEGYRVQGSAYRKMADASRLEAEAQEHAATGATWGAAIKGATAVASLFTGGGGIGPGTFSGNDMFGFSEDPDSLAQSSRGGGFGGGVFR